MAKESFGILTTNRASVTRHIEFFKKNKQGDESLISPRPKPGTFQQRYFVLLKFIGDSKNQKYFTTHKSFKEMTKEEYQREREAIEYYWEA
jgi:hypothetical protein